MTPRNIVILGAISAIAGCFCPFIHLPFVGSINYVLNGKGDGTWVALLSVVALIFASCRVSVVGAIAAAIIGFLLLRLQGVMTNALASIHETAGRSGFLSGLANAMADAVYLEYGFYLVAAGAALMLLGGIASLFIGKASAAESTVTASTDAAS